MVTSKALVSIKYFIVAVEDCSRKIANTIKKIECIQHVMDFHCFDVHYFLNSGSNTPVLCLTSCVDIVVYFQISVSAC